MTAQPIPTHYAGITFRSRLEARWAVFFDVLGIQWEYEPQGYIIQMEDYEEGYLPDFLLPDCGTWIEVKGNESKLDKRLMLAAAEQLPSEHRGHGERGPGLLILGSIPPKQSGYNSDVGDWGWTALPVEESIGWKPGLLRYGFGLYRKNLRPWFLCTTRSDNLNLWLTPSWDPDEIGVAFAYDRARTARFEYGETPVVVVPKLATHTGHKTYPKPKEDDPYSEDKCPEYAHCPTCDCKIHLPVYDDPDNRACWDQWVTRDAADTKWLYNNDDICPLCDPRVWCPYGLGHEIESCTEECASRLKTPEMQLVVEKIYEFIQNLGIDEANNNNRQPIGATRVWSRFQTASPNEYKELIRLINSTNLAKKGRNNAWDRWGADAFAHEILQNLNSDQAHTHWCCGDMNIFPGIRTEECDNEHSCTHWE